MDFRAVGGDGSRSATEKTVEKTVQLVTFRLGNDEFGLHIISVEEIIRIQTITRIPQMPDFIEGVINLRGAVIPVVDLRKRFDIGEHARDGATRIIVVRIDDRLLGFIVDSVSEVVKFDESTVEATPAILAGVARPYLQGICKLRERLILLLEPSKILQPAEMNAIGGPADPKPATSG